MRSRRNRSVNPDKKVSIIVSVVEPANIILNVLFKTQMKNSFDRKVLSVFVLAAVALAAWLGARALNEPDEGRYAEVAREMAVSSDWLVPKLCGLAHLQKPPMFYWLAATSIRVLGVNEWAVRLPSAVAALLTILLTMHMAGLLFGETARWKAGLILLSSALFFVLARVVTTDMVLTFWTTAAICAFVHYVKRSSVIALCFFYLCVGFGFLTKGPMALLVPFAAVIPLAICNRPAVRHPAWRWHWIPGILIAGAIGISWFVIIIRQHPEMLRYYLGYEFIDRIASNTHNREKPFWYYAAVLILGFLPWTAAMPKLIRDEFRRGLRGRSAEFFFLAGWLLIPLIVLQLSKSKLATYTLPMFPALALIVAGAWERGRIRPGSELRVVAAVFAVLMAAVPVILIVWKGEANASAILSPVKMAAAFAISIGWIIVYAFYSEPRSTSGVLAMIGVMIVFTYLLLAASADKVLIQGRRTVKRTATAVLELTKKYPNARIYAMNMRSFSYEFYLGRQIIRNYSAVDHILPVPAELESWFVDKPADFLESHPEEEFIVMMDRYFVPPELPPTWTFEGQFRNTVLIHRAPQTNSIPSASSQSSVDDPAQSGE